MSSEDQRKQYQRNLRQRLAGDDMLMSSQSSSNIKTFPLTNSNFQSFKFQQ